jgi:hypothetical protein
MNSFQWRHAASTMRRKPSMSSSEAGMLRQGHRRDTRFLWLWMSSIAIGFGWATSFGFITFEERAIYAVSIGSICVTVIAGTFRRAIYRGKFTEVMFWLAFGWTSCAIFNCIISLKRQETFVRWICWFALIISLLKVVRSLRDLSMRTITDIAMLTFSGIGVALHIKGLISNGDDAIRAYHLSGLYADFAFTSFLLSRRPIKWFAGIVAIIMIFTSGATGALVTAIVSLCVFAFLRTGITTVKALLAVGCIGVAAGVTYESGLWDYFISLKVNPYAEETGIDRLRRSGEDRIDLAKDGFIIAGEYPRGTGLGNTYDRKISAYMDVSHVHNGNISTLIRLGWVGLILYLASIAIVVGIAASSPRITIAMREVVITYMATFFTRSLSENYSLFDLGNYCSFFILFLTSCVLVSTTLRGQKR